MTRDEALLKLVALGPVGADELRSITGWPTPEVHRCVKELVRRGLIVYAHAGMGIRMLVLTRFAEPLFPHWNPPCA